MTGAPGLGRGGEERGRAVRSYREVFALERRLYRIDRWSIPLRGGVEVRAIVYGLCIYLALLVARALPPLRWLHEALPPAVGWLVMPLGLAAGLARFRPDGRVSHYAALSIVRWMLDVRRVAGLRRVWGTGPLLIRHVVVVCSDWRDGSLPPSGVLRGPVVVTVRRDARIERRRGRSALVVDLASAARRRGKRVAVPAGQVLGVESAGAADAGRPGLAGDDKASRWGLERLREQGVLRPRRP